MLRKWGCLGAVLLGAIILAVMATTPPAPRGMDTPAGEFSSARAMEDVRIIAAKPHPTGSAENAKVRTYLKARMQALGLEVSESRSALEQGYLDRLNAWSGEAKTSQEIVNIIGILRGTDSSKPALLLMAHHDTVWGSPGAADDTIGIASIFEIIRALNNDDAERPRDIIVLLTDAEEIGLVGARHFFAKNPLADRIGAVINFEARGGGGTANMFQTSAENGEVARVFARAVKQPSVSSLSVFIYNVLPNDTDLTPALKRDYAAYNIANIGRAEQYHSPASDADGLGENTLQHMGSQGLDLTRALAAAEGLPAKKTDAVFFDVFGLFTVFYAPIWGWLFLLAAVILYAASIKREPKPEAILSGALKMLGFLVIGAGLLYGFNALSIKGSSADYYDRLAAIPQLTWLALIVSVTVFAALFGQRPLSANERFGVMLPLLSLGLIGQALAPTASYFIVLALLLCGIAAFALSRAGGKPFGPIIAAVTAILVIAYMIMLGHLLMLGVGPNVPSVAILPASLAVMALLPLYPGLPKKWNKAVGGAGLVLATVLALWVRLDPIAATVPLY
ncbi:MAG: M20/M25/M40 family metallo-hydrolase [Maricaulaceae bacterium]